ncbi:MAG: hypothetical protein JOY54_16295 [Acidobacteriaceae bacterium]|nr:hypothetical protein [Acidobacteriaceae bacterium]
MRKSSIFTGRYLFHFHTRHTDGELSIEDYFTYARNARVDRLIFLEHIRRQPTYDVEKFASEVIQASQRFGIDAVLGFEAKLLPEGDLDISDEHFTLAKVIGIAEHRFTADITLLQDALCRTIDRYRVAAGDTSLVWVHPGLTFLKSGVNPVDNPIYESMIRWARGEQLLVEQNLRYKLVPESALQIVENAGVVLGADAHTAADLELWADTLHRSRIQYVGEGALQEEVPGILS